MHQRAMHSDQEVATLESINGQEFAGYIKVDGDVLVPVFAKPGRSREENAALIKRLNQD